MDNDYFLEMQYEDLNGGDVALADNWDAELFDDSDIDIPLDWDPDDTI